MKEFAPAIACSLTSDDLAIQADDWRRLRAAAEIGVENTRDGVRLRFRCDGGVAEELRRLTDIENVCCSWAEWLVSEHPAEVLLDVRSVGDGVRAAQRLFAQAVSGS